MTIQLSRSQSELIERAPDRLRGILAGEELLRVPIEMGVTDRAKGTGLKAPNGAMADVKMVASTERLATDNGIVPVSAWERDLARFFPNNPVILFGHQHSLPIIGQAVDVRLRKSGDKRMLQWWRFNEHTELAVMTKEMFAEGDMRMSSVGFRVLQWHRVTEDELKKLKKKQDFEHVNEFTWITDRAELLETSAVAVGADPGAVVEATAQGTLEKWAAEDGDGARRAWAGAILERSAEVQAVLAPYLVQTVREDAPAPTAPEPSQEGWQPWSVGNINHDVTLTAMRAEGSDMKHLPGQTPAPASATHAPDSLLSLPELRHAYDPEIERATMTANADVLSTRHAWRDVNKPATSAEAYRFPHHRASDGMVIFRGVARGLLDCILWEQASEQDRASAYTHLVGHYGDFGREGPTQEALAAAVKDWPAYEFEIDRSHVAWALRYAELLKQFGGGDAALGFDVIIEGTEPEGEYVEVEDALKELAAQAAGRHVTSGQG